MECWRGRLERALQFSGRAALNTSRARMGTLECRESTCWVRTKPHQNKATVWRERGGGGGRTRAGYVAKAGKV
eukprot:5731141-Pleurochrysis_carterae.AAC.1